MQDYDYSSFFDASISPLERLNVIQKGVEYVIAEKTRKDNFMGFSQRAKKAFDVCIGHDEITDSEVERFASMASESRRKAPRVDLVSNDGTVVVDNIV